MLVVMPNRIRSTTPKNSPAAAMLFINLHHHLSNAFPIECIMNIPSTKSIMSAPTNIHPHQTRIVSTISGGKMYIPKNNHHATNAHSSNVTTSFMKAPSQKTSHTASRISPSTRYSLNLMNTKSRRIIAAPISEIVVRLI